MIQMEQENNQLAFDPDCPSAESGSGDLLLFFGKTLANHFY